MYWLKSYIQHLYLQQFERSRDLTSELKENFIAAEWIYQKTHHDGIENCKDGLWEREKKKGIPSWCSIYTSNPTAVCVFVVELPPATKARQPRSIRSLCVWLHTSQLGRWYYINAGCFQKICRLYAGQRWNTSGFETEKNKEGGSVSHHSTYSNDTLTPTGWNEWKCESAILTHAPLFPCFRTDQLWRRCRKCLWLPETAD